MFVFTVHKPQKKYLYLLLPVLSVLLAGLLFLIPARKNSLSFNGSTLNTAVRDEQDIRRIASFFHLEYSPSTLRQDTVYIPTHFNVVYDAYDQLQQPLGLSLTGYKGRQVTRYTAELPQSELVMTILVCDGRFIGGDLCSKNFFGEQLPLSARYPAP